MKPIVKLIILVIIIFALSIFAVKKSIDYTFKKAETTTTDTTVQLTF